MFFLKRSSLLRLLDELLLDELLLELELPQDEPELLRELDELPQDELELLGLLDVELPQDEPELLRELDELPHEDGALDLVDELFETLDVLLFLLPKPLVVGLWRLADVVLNDFCERVGAASDLALAVTVFDDLLALGLVILRVVVVLGVLRVMRVVLVVVSILVLYEL